VRSKAEAQIEQRTVEQSKRLKGNGVNEDGQPTELCVNKDLCTSHSAVRIYICYGLEMERTRLRV